MARRRRERMSEGKKNIIAGLIQEYNIKTAEDIQEALKDLLGGTIQEMMEAELDEHLGYDEYERSDNPDYRNGVKHKKLRSSYGEIPIDVPQDRDGDFEPQIVPKRKKDISEIEQKIIAMSAKGMTTRQISDIVEAGGVAAAIESESGRIYTGVCVDGACTLGICAERNALFNMISNGESRFRRVIAVNRDGKAMPPCGACRELMSQIMPRDYKNVQIMLDFEKDRVVTLGKLTPEWWI